jgi:enterochelin esterase-like enzyme
MPRRRASLLRGPGPAKVPGLMTVAADQAPATPAAPETPEAGPVVDRDTIRFTFPDADRALSAVRLVQDVRIPGDLLGFVWAGGAWTLHIDRPPVDRLEYKLELAYPDGGQQSTIDPGNPVTTPGAFGDKSVLELPGYQRPDWLDSPAPPGRARPLEIPTRSVKGGVEGRLWSPPGTETDQPLPLLVVHDGPEYDELAQLTTYLCVLIAEGRIPPLRAALLAPGPRDDWYSADGAYTRALCLAVLPYLKRTVATTRTIGMGASLGALAMLHAHRGHAGVFDGLFLQSGSFFHARHDAHERRFSHYDRVVRAIDTVLRARGHRDPVPVVLTCGVIEENMGNNRIMARALRAQGYDVALHEVRDVHNYVAWRDAFDPCLTGLLGGEVRCATPS